MTIFLRVVNGVNFILGKVPIGPINEVVMKAVRSMQIMCKLYETKSNAVGIIIDGIDSSPFPLPGKDFARFSQEDKETKGKSEGIKL